MPWITYRLVEVQGASRLSAIVRQAPAPAPRLVDVLVDLGAQSFNQAAHGRRAFSLEHIFLRGMRSILDAEVAASFASRSISITAPLVHHAVCAHKRELGNSVGLALLDAVPKLETACSTSKPVFLMGWWTAWRSD